jgi:phosphatidylinositol glycan class Z
MGKPSKERQSPISRQHLLSYTVLTILQLMIAPLLPGYVHPDEFFQGGQELWFGCPTTKTWEFQSNHAVRSVLQPGLITYIPLTIYAWITRQSVASMSGLEVLLIPRILCTLLCIFIVYRCIWLLSGGSQCSIWMAMTSWPSWIMLCRPFSNSLETAILCILLYMTLTDKTNYYRRDLLVGMLCALGLFTRFTFVFYAMPPMLGYLVDKLRHTSTANSVVLSLVGLVMGFLGTSSIIILADYRFYGKLVLTPLNALLYNVDPNNLQEHGLHPRWTHMLVNMFILFGPLAMVFYRYAARLVWVVLSRQVRKDNQADELPIRVRNTCLWTIISGLGMLSCAPHQEPRFLLPIFVPLCVLIKDRDMLPSNKLRGLFLATWVCFNIILLLLFGVLHQGGLVPVLLRSLSTSDPDISSIFLFRTYMPPTFVARKRIPQCEEQNTESPVCVHGDAACPFHSFVDVQDDRVEVLLRRIEDELLCLSADKSRPDSTVLLVAPPLNDDEIELYEDCFLGEPYLCQVVGYHFPHLTTEDFPLYKGSLVDVIQRMRLGVYKISCAKEKRTTGKTS